MALWISNSPLLIRRKDPPQVRRRVRIRRCLGACRLDGVKYTSISRSLGVLGIRPESPAGRRISSFRWTQFAGLASPQATDSRGTIKGLNPPDSPAAQVYSYPHPYVYLMGWGYSAFRLRKRPRDRVYIRLLFHVYSTAWHYSAFHLRKRPRDRVYIRFQVCVYLMG